ncbi:hypothetical protein H9P43_004931 [Blastocladiella emersonii ATCC 22665]|nr:hypothetical protein H9P43_004931 [Blastocladiella emersonii ATCC 22665]
MDCGPVNPLGALKQQFDQDTFQDSFRGAPQGFRQPNVTADALHRQDLAEEFLRSSAAGPSSAGAAAMMGPPDAAAFAFRDLHQELDLMHGPPPPPAAVMAGKGKGPVTADWHAEFATFQHTSAPAPHMSREEMAHFDAAFASARESHAVAAAAPAWAHEFQSAGPAAPVELTAADTQALERAFEDARAAHATASWGDEFAQAEQAKADAWASEFATDREELAKTAGELLEAVGDRAHENPKFSNSEFLKFMGQLRDQEVTIEGDKVVENTGGTWASDFSSRVDNYVESMWSKEFGNQYQGIEGDWAEDFDGLASFGTGLEDAASSVSWARQFDEMAAATGAPIERLAQWNMDLPEYAAYDFEPANAYLGQPVDQLRALPLATLPLAESILALEARVQADPRDAAAWTLLGIKQQENERERQAISALRRALEADPAQLDAWLALSVSYTNENHPEPAFDSLRQWIRNNPKYAPLADAIVTSGDSFRDVSSLFLEAATSGGEVIDADVQVGLGVLFNVSEEYAKAVDCFQAALAARPDDYLLWNKLGATLANSHDASRAMDAYFHALAINPSYIRARYNLAISCINLGQHREAAHHLIEALQVQAAGGNGSVTSGFTSSNVWETLKMAALLMNKADWAAMCDTRDLSAIASAYEADA